MFLCDIRFVPDWRTHLVPVFFNKCAEKKIACYILIANLFFSAYKTFQFSIRALVLTRVLARITNGMAADKL